MEYGSKCCLIQIMDILDFIGESLTNRKIYPKNFYNILMSCMVPLSAECYMCCCCCCCNPNCNPRFSYNYGYSW